MGSFQIRLYRKLPLGLQVYPLDAGFAVLGLISGVLSLFVVSASAENLALGWRWAWSASLIIGCSGWLAGVLSVRPGTNRRNVIITRVPVMVAGVTVTSTSAFVYALLIFFTASDVAIGLSGGLYLMIFCMCTWGRRLNLLSGLEDAT